MLSARLFSVGTFVGAAWMMAAPAMPGGCGGVGGGGSGGEGPAPVCGNGIQEGLESCDGGDFFQSKTCASYDEYAGGTLKCHRDCTFDFSECRPTVCGDGVVEGGENCDGNTFRQGVNLDCTSWSDNYLGGKMRCNEFCQYDSSGCVTDICGNGRIDTYELCDGNLFRQGNNRCEVLDAAKYSGGTLRCGPSCTPDTSACVPVVCGDGRVEAGEECDGANLGNAQTCSAASPAYAGGVLRCGADCQYDESGCVLPVCGDGRIAGYEQCEGANLGSFAGQDCSDFIYGISVFGIETPYRPGPLTCSQSSCQLDLSQCRPQPGCYLTLNCGPLPTRPCPPTVHCVP